MLNNNNELGSSEGTKIDNTGNDASRASSGGPTTTDLLGMVARELANALFDAVEDEDQFFHYLMNSLTSYMSLLVEKQGVTVDQAVQFAAKRLKEQVTRRYSRNATR